MVRFYLLFTLILIPLYIPAQEISPELKKLLKASEIARINNDYEKAIHYLSRKDQSVYSKPDELAYIHAYKSRIYANMDSLKLAKSESDLSFDNSQKSLTIGAKAIGYYSKAYMDYNLNNSDGMIENCLNALQILGDNAGNESLKGHLNYLLYTAYIGWEEVDKAAKYAQNSVKFAKKGEDWALLGNSYNAFSSIFQIKFKEKQRTAYQDSSWHYLQKAWQLTEEFPDETGTTITGMTAINISNHLLGDTMENKNHYETNLKKVNYYLKEAERKLNKNNLYLLANIYGIKSEFAVMANQLKVAETYLHKSLAVALSNEKNPNYDVLYHIYYSLSKLSADKLDFKQALDYRNHAEQALRNQFKSEVAKNSQLLEIQYETAEKENELQYLIKQAEAQKIVNRLWYGIIAVVFIGLFFMFRSYHFKLRYSVEREKKLAKEKEETKRRTELQLQFSREEQARLKAERELMNVQQEKLEKEVLLNALQLERKNEILGQIKKRIEDGDPQIIRRLLKQESLTDYDFDSVKMEIQNLNPDFIKSINEKSQQKLTNLDLKYCSYLKLGMTTNQIAQILNVEIQTVRTFKYRLKRKIGLEKDEDLDLFLKGLN